MAAFESDLDLKVLPSVRWHVLLAKACQTPLWPDNVEHRWVTIHMLDSSSFTFRHRWCPQSGLRVQAIFPGSTLHSFHLFELFSILCWEVSGTCLPWGWSAQFLLSLTSTFFLPHMGTTLCLVCAISLPFICSWSVMLNLHRFALISSSRWICFPSLRFFPASLLAVLHAISLHGYYFYITLYTVLVWSTCSTPS